MDFFYIKNENKGAAAARIGIKGHAPLSQFLNSSFILQLRLYQNIKKPIDVFVSPMIYSIPLAGWRNG